MNYRNLFKAITILTVVIAVSCNTGQSKKGQSGAISNDSIIILDDYSDIKVNYPVVNQILLDDSIQKKMNGLVHEFEKISNSIPDTFYRPYQMVVDYELSEVNKKFVSISFSIYQYTGGAHGNTFYISYLYDKKAKEMLYLKDILPNGTFAELRNLVRNKLKAKLSYQDFIDDGTENMVDFERFVITDSSVVFLFQPYDVAPFSEGSQRIEILKTEFSFLLD